MLYTLKHSKTTIDLEKLSVVDLWLGEIHIVVDTQLIIVFLDDDELKECYDDLMENWKSLFDSLVFGNSFNPDDNFNLDVG